MEARGSSHHWARELSKLGHDVRLIPANYVKPYVKRGKSDAGDAEAICEAVTRPTMRFVAPKTEAQQAVLFLHRARDLIVRHRTQLSNMLRSLLVEFGIIIAQGTGNAVKFAKRILDGDRPALSSFLVFKKGSCASSPTRRMRNAPIDTEPKKVPKNFRVGSLPNSKSAQ